MAMPDKAETRLLLVARAKRAERLVEVLQGYKPPARPVELEEPREEVAAARTLLALADSQRERVAP